MSRSARSVPHSAHRAPATFLLRVLRPTARWVLRRWVSVDLVHPERMPTTGPVITVGNHIGALDGPLMAIFSPRPVHALTKQEMFTGPLAWALPAVGQVRVDRFRVDPAAIRAALTVLRTGGVAGLFPEGTRGAGDYSGAFHHGAAYLALVTGAPVVPITFVGSGPEPGSDSSVPARGSRVHMVYGTPWQVEAQPWPRTKQQVAYASAALQQHLRAERARALVEVGVAPTQTPERNDADADGVSAEGEAS